jgi:hypothetical protein
LRRRSTPELRLGRDPLAGRSRARGHTRSAYRGAARFLFRFGPAPVSSRGKILCSVRSSSACLCELTLPHDLPTRSRIVPRRRKFCRLTSSIDVDNACVTCGICVEDCERIPDSLANVARPRRVFLCSHNSPLDHNPLFRAKTKATKSFPRFHTDHHNNKAPKLF